MTFAITPSNAFQVLVVLLVIVILQLYFVGKTLTNGSDDDQALLKAKRNRLLAHCRRKFVRARHIDKP